VRSLVLKKVSATKKLSRFSEGSFMDDIFLTIGEFGKSSLYRQIIGEVTIPGKVVSVSEDRVMVADDLKGLPFLIPVREVVSPGLRSGDIIDLVVLVEPGKDQPGLASERRACREGVNVDVSFGEVVRADEALILVKVDGESYSVARDSLRRVPQVGGKIKVSRHTSGAIWLG